MWLKLSALLRRDARLMACRWGEAALPMTFVLVIATLFPFGVGPEPQLLRQLGPAVIWIAALLATVLGMPGLFAPDLHDGALEQLFVAGMPLALVALSRTLMQWLVSGLPVVVLCPLVAALYGMDGVSSLVLGGSLVLGTLVVSFIAAMGAALMLDMRGGGGLLMLLVLPLCVPVLIFGTGVVQATEAGVSAAGHWSLLGALFILTVMGAPLVTAAALRLALE